ncbi:hypothetical protein JCM11641_006479 [Rhodosporidiobolus odoratus]
MAPSSTILPVLAFAAFAHAQSSTASNATTTTSASIAGETVLTVPAYGTEGQGMLNATVTAGWSTQSGMGTLTQGFTLLQNSTTTAQNGTIYGLVLEFNSSIALADTNATRVPWLAYISCDTPITTVPANSSSTTSSSAGLTSSTASASADGSAVNGTSGSNQTQTETLSLIDLAAGLGARGIILYSDLKQSCVLNYTSLANSTSNTTSLPIFTSPSTEIHDYLHSSFNNILPAYAFYNSTLLTQSLSNLSSIVSAASNGSSSSSSNGVSGTLTTPTNYLVARIEPYYERNSSSNGVVATIGRASPTGEQPSATGSVGSQNGGDSSGAAAGFGRKQGGRSTLGLVVTGVFGGAVVAGLGVLV